MEQVYTTILKRLNNLIVVANPNGDVEYVSPSVKAMLGFEPNELLGDGWWNFTKSGEEQTVTFIEYINRLFESKATNSGTEITYERQLSTALGENKWILWNTSKGPDDTIISIGSDITKRKQAEKELEEKNRNLQQQHEDIIDSIQYARKIQDAMLPSVKKITENLSDGFVLYLPKDLVSGDFYWYYKNGSKLFVAVADCTGHGVPGALMSVMGNSVFKDIVEKGGEEDPAEILKALDAGINNLLQKEEGYDVMSDGMDVSLVSIDLSTNRLLFSGAMRPLWVVRNNELIELKGNRFPIGYFYGVEKNFTNLELQLEQGDYLYLFSDGYADQFGGEREKKFNTKKLKELLLSINSMNGEEQQGFLEYALKNWRQDIDQTDDVCLLGLQI
ncbi:MAG: SpoIIE family protein phosphatase [Flavobacteriales bacterium]|nr:SpoIIE family protein phosphatase [Flavobacteriales bacterium]